MKKRLLSIYLLLAMLISSQLSACTYTETNENTTAVYYCLGETDDITDLIEKYNKSCSLYGDKNDRIEIRHFDSEEEFISTISTEIMSDEGPDFFSLDQTLPFEKFIENATLADIDEMIKAYGSSINFDDYNKTVMDSGVFNDHRYIIPFFYSIDTLYSTKDRTDALNINPKTITYEELAKLKSSGEYDFIYAEDYEKYNSFIYVINQYVDFTVKETYFDTEEFSLAIDIMTTLFQNNEEPVEDYFFENPKVLTRSPYALSGGSVEAVARTYCIEQASGKELILFPTYNRNGKTSAYIQAAIAVNENSDKKELIMNFIEFALSDQQQAYHCGALRKERMYSGGIVALPVKNSVLEDALELEITDILDIEDDGIVTDEEININEKKVTFLENEFIPLLKSFEDCSIYNYRILTESYYAKNVIQNILDKYLNGDITKNKFITQLETATQIYMME